MREPLNVFRLAGRQLAAAAALTALGLWLWPHESAGASGGWAVRLAAIVWLIAALALVAACFWITVGLVDGQWKRSGFTPGRWLSGNKRRR